jgi:hypothetical protein
MMTTAVNPERERWEIRKLKLETYAIAVGLLGSLYWAVTNTDKWMPKPPAPAIKPLPADPPPQVDEDVYIIPKISPIVVPAHPDVHWQEPVMRPLDPDRPPPVFYPVSNPVTPEITSVPTEPQKTVSQKKPKNGIQKFGDAMSNGWDFLVRVPMLSLCHTVMGKVRK